MIEKEINILVSFQSQQQKPMIDENINPFRFGDASPEAMKMRLRSARIGLALGSQETTARTIGIPEPTYKSVESRGSFNRIVLAYFYQRHGLDANFFIFGAIDRMPDDIFGKLKTAVTSENSN